MWPVQGVALAFVVILWFGLLALPGPTAGEDTSEPVKQRSSALTRADAEWVKKGDGKLTEAELLTRLGPADELRSPGNVVADYAMIWRDRTVIRVKFEKDKAVEYTGWFSGRLPHKTATLESFKKLKKGLSDVDVEQILGSSDHETKEHQYWGSHRSLTVYIKSGKVAGYSWRQNSTDGWD